MERFCHCAVPTPSSPVSNQCGECGGEIFSRETIEELAAKNREATDERPDGNEVGNLQVAQGAARPDRQSRESGLTRRWLLAKGFAGYVAGLPTWAKVIWGLGGAATGAIASASTIKQWVEQKQRRGMLLVEDIFLVRKTLPEGLPGLISSLAGQDRQAAMRYARAIAGHHGGTDPKSAEIALETLVKDQDDDQVKLHLLEDLGRVRALNGKVREGLRDLETAISLVPSSDDRTRVRLLRQTMSHAYIALPRDKVLKPDSWPVRKYLREALEIMDLVPKSDPLSPLRIERAKEFHPAVGPGVLVFEAYVRACEVSSVRERQRIFDWHLDLLKAIEADGGDPLAAWIRHMPLAAQAIALGHIGFAQKVLDRAAAAGRGVGRPGVVQFAAWQRENLGIEWLVLNVGYAALYLKRGERRKARQALEIPLRECAKAPSLLRAAQLYRLATIPDKSENLRRQCQALAFNPPAFSHWTYFPGLPEGERLWG